MTNYKLVCTFNKTFEHPHHDDPQYNILKNKSITSLRVNLCIEEANELEDGFNNKNFNNVIDAIVDELYVAYGLGSSFGINIDYLFRYKVFTLIYEYIHPNKPPLDINNYESILMKCTESNEININDMTNFNLLKYYLIKSQEPLFTEERCNSTNFDNIFINSSMLDYENVIAIIFELRCNINSHIKKLELAAHLEKFEDVASNIVNIIFFTYKLGIFLGINIDKAFNLVHESNMSKLCKNLDEAIKTVDMYKTLNRYKLPDYRKCSNGEYYIVFDKETGKILKSINYNQVDFKTIMKD